MWIKKNADVVVQGELEFSSNSINQTNAYEATITEAYIQKAKNSESVSVVIGIKTDSDETAKTFFTVMGKDGKEYFVSSVKGKEVKKQHFGLSIVNSLFKLVLEKEIFDCDPESMTIQQYDKDEKEMKDVKVDGFPILIGKKIGACVQIIREIKGADSKEYPNIVHFFDTETGLFADEETGKVKTKLDMWLAGKKEFQIVQKEEAPKTSFGGSSNKEDAPKSKWSK